MNKDKQKIVGYCLIMFGAGVIVGILMATLAIIGTQDEYKEPSMVSIIVNVGPGVVCKEVIRNEHEATINCNISEGD